MRAAVRREEESGEWFQPGDDGRRCAARGGVGRRVEGLARGAVGTGVAVGTAETDYPDGATVAARSAGPARGTVATGPTGSAGSAVAGEAQQSDITAVAA